jgi:hypothetical protein
LVGTWEALGTGAFSAANNCLLQYGDCWTGVPVGINVWKACCLHIQDRPRDFFDYTENAGIEEESWTDLKMKTVQSVKTLSVYESVVCHIPSDVFSCDGLFISVCYSDSFLE